MNELLEQQIEQLKRDKAKLLTKLGQSIYHQYRIGNIYSEELNDYAEQILHIDKKIYDFLLEDSVETTNLLRCECGHVVGPEDAFCGKCGKEVIKESAGLVNHCEKCDVELVMHSKFCHVCGTRQKRE